MPLNTRDLAAETLLLIASATLLFMGGAGLLIGLLLPETLFGPMLVPDASVATLLIGIGLLATLCQVRWLRLLSAAGLAALLLYTLVHNALDQGIAASLITQEMRMTTLSVLILAWIAVCLWVGVGSGVRRLYWRTTGIGLLLFGGLVVTRLWASDASYRPLFSSSPIAVLVFIVLLGAALLVAGWRHRAERLSPGKLTVTVGLAGVLVSSLAWLLLSMNQRATIELQASYLLDNVQLNAEQAMSDRLQLMHRMAERLGTLPDDQRTALLPQDAQSYFRDTLSLNAISLVDAQGRLIWSQGRQQGRDVWLVEQLAKPSVQAWLAVPFDRPRLLMPDSDQHSMMLMALPVPNRAQQLLAAVDLSALLNHELSLALGPFQVGVSRGEQLLMILHPSGFAVENVGTLANALATRLTGLPGGVNLMLRAYPGQHYNWYLLGVMPISVAMGGLLMSWLLAFSVGVVGATVARTRELAAARHSLEESEQRYRSLFVHHPDAVFSLDKYGCFQTANTTCADVTGYPLDEVVGRHFTDFIALQERERIDGHFKHVLQGGITRYEVTITDREAQQRTLDLISLPVTVNGRIEGVYGIAQDVTEKRRQQTRLRTLERSVEASVNGVLIADARHPDLPIIYANQAFSTMTGYSQHEVLGQNCRFLQGPDSDAVMVSKLRRGIREQRETHVTLCNYRKDGTPFWNDLYVAPVRDSDGQVTHFVGVQHDISKHKAYEAQLAYHATHDDLTCLPNRMMFEETLCKQFAAVQGSAERISVLFVDLDDFKPINDTLGHAVGDSVLVEVAKRLRAGLRQHDTVARLGGDEFVLLITNTGDARQVVEVVERLLPSLAKPYCIDGHELYLTASVGIAMSQPDTLLPQTLIQQADMAMYKAKQQGRNAYAWFSSDINDIASERVSLRNDLQEAIDHQGFELHYQPIMDRQGKIASVEALLRWPHPSKGYISPARFIPLAEATGQIMPISEWVLQRACQDMLALQRSGLGALRVAVNLSPLQFHRESFLATLRQTLADTGLPAEQLSLELTEGILMDNTASAIEILHALRSMQVSVSIDDFGTGYSSLSYLKHLPISTVKIDRSFIHELTNSSDDAAIVQGIISMAHHLGLNVVAEGVETSEQHQRLLTYHCDGFQGFGLAKPMPLAELESLLAAQEVNTTPVNQ
ncbi:EAL domain-containing protein [Vreelandella aquamarina]|uniref:bifunctional diguanylate cyclase/phosphodiesterase n=1 Tax=Vreelandella aquamarina TaxID=77097 RepID=UPI00384A9C64